MSKYLDKIFYINLDKRADRRAEIESELANCDLLSGKAERIEAVPTPNQGILGCTMSHLNALRLAKERGYKNVLILEDDFQFTIPKEEFENQLTALFETGPEFDVCMISYNIQQSIPAQCPFLHRVLAAQTASGYIVSESFYDEIITLYEWAVPLLEHTKEHWNYANDQCWKKLQTQSRWYALKTRCGRQRAGYSDNSGQYEDHDC